MPTAGDIPVSRLDLYSDDALAEPYEHYRSLRELGPVVWMETLGVFAVTRHEDVRSVLSDPDTYCSGYGVGLNDIVNELGRGTTLMSDGEDHRQLRSIIGRPLTPKALLGLRAEARTRAAQLVQGLVTRRSFDAVPDLAEVLPSTWVPDLLGWPSDGRGQLLEWAAATFDGLGPLNDRTFGAAQGVVEMASFAEQVAASTPPPGSMAAGILAAADAGELDAAQCPMAIIDYLGPSLDTTISGLGNAVWLFATHPDQWQLLREDPSRVRQAFDEVLRLESPISGFTRVATRPTELGGCELPLGARVLVSFASANRDERYWEDPERFDITRASASHVAFGFGDHACPGMGLARLEATEVLSALITHVERFDLAGPPVRKLNNLIRSFASLPITVTPSRVQ